MNTKPHWTKSELSELAAKAGGLFSTLIQLTDTPREAAEIISMIHMLLYLNCGDGKTSCDTMLADYTKNFKMNWELQVAHKEGLN